MSNQPATTMNIKNISEQLWQTNQQGLEPKVYVLLDAARDKQIEPLVRLGKLRSECLYQGKLDYAMARSAPYLVRLEKDHPQTDEILRKGWGNSWGVFAITYPPATLINIRHNCRKIAKVKGPGGKNLVFRYYDPRVLRSYLPTCSTDEAKQVFGPITEFIIEGENPNTLHRFTQTDSGVIDLNENTDIELKSALLAEKEAQVVTLAEQDLDPELSAVKEKVGGDFIRQAIGYLKIKALAETDPNNPYSLEILCNSALSLSIGFKFEYDTPEQLANIAHTIDLWGEGYPMEEWAYTVFIYRKTLSLDEKITELYREKAFQMVGPEAIDYPTYCILRFKDRSPDTEYDNTDIAIAAHIGLEAAKKYNFTDLNSAYNCTELMLIYGDDFTENEQCQPIIDFFEDDKLSAFEKTYHALNWLVNSMSADVQGEV